MVLLLGYLAPWTEVPRSELRTAIKHTTLGDNGPGTPSIRHRWWASCQIPDLATGPRIQVSASPFV